MSEESKLIVAVLRLEVYDKESGKILSAGDFDESSRDHIVEYCMKQLGTKFDRQVPAIINGIALRSPARDK